MAENPPSPAAPAHREKPRHGPGPLLLFGLFFLAVTAWCAKDSLFPPDAWMGKEKGQEEAHWKIWLNVGGMVAALVLSAYCFVLAARRAKKPPEASAARPTEGSPPA